MELHPQYWHWIVFGMLLIIAELFVPSFTVFWFGLAGLIVGGVLLVAPATVFKWQLFLWAVASGCMTYLWFKLFKPLMADRTKAGISREAILGEIGQVIRAPEEDRRGTVRFTTPLLGAEGAAGSYPASSTPISTATACVASRSMRSRRSPRSCTRS